jgi:Beta-lactamase class A
MEAMINKRNFDKLEEYFRNEAAGFPGKVAYLYADMDNFSIHFEKNSKDMVVSASMIKVPVMMCVFHLIRKGEFSLQTEIMVEENQILEDTHVFEYGSGKVSIYELVVWMIVNSDNTATNVLLNLIGFDRLNDYFQKIGLLHTKAERLMLDYQAIENGKNNWISVQDFFHCMKQLKEEECNNVYAGLAITVLKRNRDYDSLCRYLYEGPSVAHKSGGLDGIVHDAGIIETSEGSYFLGVFISDFAPSIRMEQEAQKLIGRLSRKVYDFEELEIR